MATIYVTFSAIVMALISSATGTNPLPRNQDLLVATEEMQRANYFTFVMLINMATPNLIPGNVTFLMPNDRALAKTLMPENAVADFLQRHSIPSPLLFDHLVHFPTGSIIPTSKPEFMLKVSNNGGMNFYLNSIRITRPNICMAGSSIRCHGIDGVVEAAPMVTGDHNTTAPHPSPTCSNSSNPSSPSWPSPLVAPPLGGVNLTPLIAPSPTELDGSTPQKSGSSQPLRLGGLSSSKFMTACLMVLMMEFSLWRN